MTWDHGQVIVVKLLESYKLVFIHLLFDIGHVSISLQRLPALDLIVELLTVQLHGLVLLISLILIKLIVEDACILSLRSIVLAQGIVICHFVTLVHVHLLK